MIKTKANKSTALVPAEANGDGGHEGLPGVLHPVLDEMVRDYAQIDSVNHKSRYEVVIAWYGIGRLVAEVVRNVSKSGEDAVARLADELSARRGRPASADDLLRAKAVTEIYN